MKLPRDSQVLRNRLKQAIWDANHNRERELDAIFDTIEAYMTEAASPSPGTGGGAKPCETCNGVREVLRLYNRGSSSPPGNQMIPCPKCRPAPGAAPWSPHDHEAKATAWGGGASGAPGDVAAAPPAEPGKPATCPEACPSERDCYAVGRCILGAGRATPEKGGT